MVKKIICFIFIFSILFHCGCSFESNEKFRDESMTLGAVKFVLPVPSRAVPGEDDIVLFELRLFSDYLGYDETREGVPGDTVIFDGLTLGFYNASVKTYDSGDVVQFEGSADMIEVATAIDAESPSTPSYVCKNCT